MCRALRSASATCSIIYSKSSQPPAAGSAVFPLHTCILARLNRELCEALLAGTPWQTGVQANLEYLESANLLTPLGVESSAGMVTTGCLPTCCGTSLFTSTRSWRLACTAVSAAWFEGREYLDEAFEHWLQSNDVAQVARLVEEYAARLLDEDELARLARLAVAITRSLF